MAFDAFMNIPDVRGEAMDRVHGGEIDVVDWKWGLSQSGTMHVPNGRHGKVLIDNLSFTKWIDRSTPILMRHCITGHHMRSCVLTIRKAGCEAIEFLTIEMRDVMVAEVNTGGTRIWTAPMTRSLENIILHFGNIKITYQPQKNDGSADGSTIIFSHDIKRNVTT